MNLDTFKKAVSKAKEESPPRKFEESIELTVNLKGIDLKRPENRIKVDVKLPHRIGKGCKILVFADGELQIDAKRKGADLVMSSGDIPGLAKNPKGIRKLIRSYDFFIAAQPLMGPINKNLGKYLGPKNKIPEMHPMGVDIGPRIETLRNTVSAKVRSKLALHLRIGNRGMNPTDIAENAFLVYQSIVGKLPLGDLNIKNISVKTTMGPRVIVEDEV